VEDGISGGLQHHHETCCEKGGHHGRRACMVQRWFYHGDIVSRQVDLYMTMLSFTFGKAAGHLNLPSLQFTLKSKSLQSL